MSDIKESLNSIREEFDKALEQVSDSQAAEQLRVSFLGKKGQLTQVLKGMGGLTAEERPVIGKIANDVRSHMESRLEEIVAKIKEEEKSHKLSNRNRRMCIVKLEYCLRIELLYVVMVFQISLKRSLYRCRDKEILLF